MWLEQLLDEHKAKIVTPVTLCNKKLLHPQPPPPLAVTPVTLVTAEKMKPRNETEPYLNNNELIIPADCPAKYKYWQAGQSVFETLLELHAPDHVIENYISELHSCDQWRQWQKIKKSRGSVNQDIEYCKPGKS